MKLVLNAVQCTKCNQVISSTHRHDFKGCKCGQIAVDGGLDYKRRAGKLDGFIERCAYLWDRKYSKPGEAAGKYIVWSPGGDTNPAMIFDHKEDAEMSATELARRVPVSDWYVAQLSHVPVTR